MRNTNKKGFTIVELVIVIAVVAVLAAVLIPTFAGLIDAANQSVDQQFVGQLNKILGAEEVIDGKAANVFDAQKILDENGIAVFEATHKRNVIYWTIDNKVILWTWDNDSMTSGKVTYPENIANSEEYKKFTKPSESWFRLDVKSTQVVVETETVEGLVAAIEEAVTSGDKNTIVKLPEKAEITTEDLSGINNAMKAGSTVTIDLNGGTFIDNDANPDATLSDDDKHNYDRINITAGSTLIISNGTMDLKSDFEANRSSISVASGSSLILRDLTLISNSYAVFPAANASEVLIENCNITSRSFSVSSNNTSSENITVTIRNSTIESTGSAAVLINCPGEVDIIDSTIKGVTQGVIVRCGNVRMTNCEVIVNATQEKLNQYAAYNNSAWANGNNLSCAGIVIGNDSHTYSGKASVTLSKVTVKVTAPTGETVPTVILAAGDQNKEVVLEYDANCVLGDIVERVRDNYTNAGTITVNGEKFNK